MHKLVIFDLDNTLAPSAQAMSNETLLKLNKLIEKGYKIAIASGKPVYYLTGFARGLGLENCIFLGENGAVITFGVKLPPKQRYVYPYEKKLNLKLKKIKEAIEDKVPGIYFQANEIAVTPFLNVASDRDKIEEVFSTLDTEGLTIYRFPTCYDVLPSVVNKGSSVIYLCELLGITKEDTISVGDAINDIEMFKVTDVSISVSPAVKEFTTFNKKSIEAALDFILDND